MSVQLEVQVTGSTADTGEYQLDWEVVNNMDMPSEVFLYTTSTDTYHGVVAPAQLSYPTDPNEGNSAYYRRSTATQTFAALTAANSAKTNILSALADLVTAYKKGVVDFLVTETFTIPEEP